MPVRKPIAIKTLIDATLQSVKGMSIRQVAKRYEVGDRAARHLAAAANITREEYMQGVMTGMYSAIGQATERLATEVDKLSVSQLPVTIGILSDKVQNWEGTASKGPTTQINVQINGESKSKEQVISGLFGNATKNTGNDCRVSVQPAHDESAKPTRVGMDVIDVDATPANP